MRLHLSTHMTPTAIVLAVVTALTLTVGASVAQAAGFYQVLLHQAGAATTLAGQDVTTGVWLVLWTAAFAAFAIACVVYAIVAIRRESAAEASEGELARLPREAEPEQKRRAA